MQAPTRLGFPEVFAQTVGLGQAENQGAYDLTRRLVCLNFIGNEHNWESLESRLKRYFAQFEETDDLSTKEQVIDDLLKLLNHLLQVFVGRGFLEKITFEYVDLADRNRHATTNSSFLLPDPGSIVATNIEWLLLDEQDIESRRALIQHVIAEKRERSRVANLEEKEAMIAFIRLFLERVNDLRKTTNKAYLDAYRAICPEDDKTSYYSSFQFLPVPDMTK